MTIYYIDGSLNVENLANMFAQKSGINPSIATTIITVVMQYVTQQLAASPKGKGGIGNITSVLSNLSADLKGDHPLVKEVQEKANLQDSQQATQYIHKAVDFVKEEAGHNPQGIESLFGDVLGGVSSAGSAGPEVGEQVKKGFGGFLKGLFGSKNK